MIGWNEAFKFQEGGDKVAPQGGLAGGGFRGSGPGWIQESWPGGGGVSAGVTWRGAALLPGSCLRRRSKIEKFGSNIGRQGRTYFLGEPDEFQNPPPPQNELSPFSVRNLPQIFQFWVGLEFLEKNRPGAGAHWFL